MAIPLVLIGAVARSIDPGLAPEGEEFTPLSIVLLATAACLVGALVLLGVASRKARRVRWSSLPLWMGVLVVSGLVAGGALAERNERLLEIPLVLFTIGWVALGYSMWESTDPPDREGRRAAERRAGTCG